ncbi:MAG: hypothetical protein HY291_13420 [Planctomycetes bacterium]|nr:hypothetical protein [Planctomycetota bacterium]
MPSRKFCASALLAAVLVLRTAAAGDADPTSSPAKGAEWSVAPLLPANSLFVISIKDKQKGFERLQQTGLWKLISDPNVQDAFKGSLTILKGRIAVAEQKLGYKLNEVWDLFQGEATFAMCGFLDARNEQGEPIPDLLFAFQPRDKAQAWMDHWGKVVDLLNGATQNTLEITSRTVAGADLVTLSHAAVPFQISYTLCDGVFMVALGPGRIENILAARAAAKGKAGGGDGQTLGENPQYLRALEKGGKDTDVIVYANIAEIRKSPNAKFGPKTDREKLEWEKIGLNSVRTVTYTLGVKEHGLGETFFFDAPEKERTGLLKLLDGPALSGTCFDKAARNSVVAVALQAEPGKLLDRILDIASVDNPNARADAAAAIDQASQKLGADIRKDLMASLSGDLLLSVSMPAKHPKIGFGFPNVILSAGLKDSAKIKTVLDAFRRTAQDKYNFGETTHGDFLIQGAQEKAPEAGKDPATFCWTVAGDRLLVSFYPLALRDELDRLSTAGSPPSAGRATQSGNLSDDADFRAVRANLPTASQVLAYVDFGAISTAAYDFFIPLGQVKHKSPPWVDINRLPSADLLAKNLGGTLINLATDADGVRVESYSSTGIFSTLFPAVAVIGEYNKNHGGGDGEPVVGNEPELPADLVAKRQFLRDLSRNVAAYAKDHGGAYPQSLVDLIPKYLKAESKDQLFEIAYQGMQDKAFKVVAYPTGIKGPLPIMLQDGSVRVIESGQLDVTLKNGFTGEKAKPYEVEAVKPPLPPPDF